MTQLHMQKSFFERLTTKSETVTMALFKIAEILLKHKKHFEDAKIWKENFIQP